MDSQRKTGLRSILSCVSKNPEPESLEHTCIDKNEASQAERQNYASDIAGYSRHQALPVDRRRPLAPEKIQPNENHKARLLHEEGESQQEAAGKQLPASPGLDGFQQDEDPGQREQHNKVRRMRGKSQDREASGKKSVSSSRHHARQPPRQTRRQQVDEQGRGRVHEKQAEVDPGSSLSKKSQNDRIRRRGAGELHSVGKLVWRDALQHELTRIGILSFVPLQRHVPQPKSDNPKKSDHQEEQCVRE